jgi:hypothetical protein
MPLSPSPRCFLCKGLATEDDFCHGCEAYVCEECCVPDCAADYTMGKLSHEPADHKEPKC